MQPARACFATAPRLLPPARVNLYSRDVRVALPTRPRSLCAAPGSRPSLPFHRVRATVSNGGQRPRHVVFAAPFFLEATLAFIDGAAQLPNTVLTVISQDPAEQCPYLNISGRRERMVIQCDRSWSEGLVRKTTRSVLS